MAEEAPPQFRERPRVNKKMIAAVVATILVLSSGFLVWYVYYRHWTMEDIAEQVIDDPTPAAPGFKHSLAGKKIVVEGKATNITTTETTLGTLTYIELDRFALFYLVVWGSVPYHTGQRITMDVDFEWSTFNDERHVFSPQLSFPALQILIPMDFVLRAVNFVNGVVELTPAQSNDTNVSISVDWVQDPIPLSIANCSLRAGRHSWVMEYVDVLGGWRYGNETDFIANLTSSEGINGTIQFLDQNADGYLDKGDLFVLRDLPRPRAASGVNTFAFFVSFRTDPETPKIETPTAQCYLTMMQDGLMRAYHDPQIVTARLLRSSEQNGIKFTCEEVEREINWSEIDVMIETESFPDFARATWSASTSELTGAGPTTKVFPATTFGSMTIQCNITDKSGNGRLDAGDFLTLTSSDNTSFSNTSAYTLSMIYERTYSSMCYEIFYLNVTPECNMSLASMPTGFKGVLAPPHTGYNTSYRPFDTPWSEVRIQLSDGTSTIAWSPSTNGLGTGQKATTSFSAAPFGPLMVFCNITDLEGNGYLNRGDCIEITTGATERFSPAVNYTMSIVFEPTSVEMFNTTLSG